MPVRARGGRRGRPVRRVCDRARAVQRLVGVLRRGPGVRHLGLPVHAEHPIDRCDLLVAHALVAEVRHEGALQCERAQPIRIPRCRGRGRLEAEVGRGPSCEGCRPRVAAVTATTSEGRLRWAGHRAEAQLRATCAHRPLQRRPFSGDRLAVVGIVIAVVVAAATAATGYGSCVVTLHSHLTGAAEERKRRRYGRRRAHGLAHRGPLTGDLLLVHL